MALKGLIFVTILLFSNLIWAQNKDPLTPERRQALIEFTADHVLVDRNESQSDVDGKAYVQFIVKETDNLRFSTDIVKDILDNLSKDSDLTVEVIYQAERNSIFIYNRKPGDLVEDILNKVR
jgi:hypothetical protein